MVMIPRNIQCGPLFAAGQFSPLTRTQLSFILRHLLHSADYNPHLYCTHSFRIGAATTAAAAGLPPWLIKTLGRWNSDAYMSYIHAPTTNPSKIICNGWESYLEHYSCNDPSTLQLCGKLGAKIACCAISLNSNLTQTYVFVVVGIVIQCCVHCGQCIVAIKVCDTYINVCCVSMLHSL